MLCVYICIKTICSLYFLVCSCCFFHSYWSLLPIITAMLYPVLLCAALLLLTPLDITEARALHPSPDAVQV